MMYSGESQTFKLADGRSLGFTQYGPTNGDPVFYFHGLFGSLIEAEASLKSAQRTNTRLIAVDRPGFGLSSFVPARRLYDWPDDIVALADSLGIQKFSLLGVTTGGPYALACAHKTPQRIRRIGISGSPAPLKDTGLLHRMHWFSRSCFNQAQVGGALGRLFFGSLLGLLAFLAPQNVERLLSHAINLSSRGGQKSGGSRLKSFSQSFAGPYYDLSLVTRPWGFNLEEISLPVRIWHGQEDCTIPMAMSRYLLEHIPYSQACFVRGEGHFSLITNYINSALLQLKAG